MPKYTAEEYSSMLNLLIAANFVLECNDNLKRTNSYRQNLKMKLKQLEPELIKIIDTDLNYLWGADDPVLYEYQDGIKEFIMLFDFKAFSKLPPEQILGFVQLTKDFFNAPELVLHRNGVKIE